MEMCFNDLKLLPDDNTCLLYDIPRIPCVYLLMLDDELRYIGQTVNLFNRIHTGHMDKLFNRILYAKCPNKILRDVIECYYVEHCFPLYNQISQHNKYLKS